ncbi:MAG: hypothetical protein ACOVO2_17670 [Emticicia sp.]|uniref:hypothetical protein n=1 Tax=Emticicia sp. TaxID=1930953 RepID=UPI003BA815C0
MKNSTNTLKKLALLVVFAALISLDTQAQFLATVIESSESEIPEKPNFTPLATPSKLFLANIRPIEKGQKIELRYWKKEGIKMTVSLYDANSHLIYERELGKYDWGNFISKYDISTLSAGAYQFTLKSGDETWNKKFEIHKDYTHSVAIR